MKKPWLLIGYDLFSPLVGRDCFMGFFTSEQEALKCISKQDNEFYPIKITFSKNDFRFLSKYELINLKSLTK